MAVPLVPQFEGFVIARFSYTASLVRNGCVQFAKLDVLLADGVLLSINGDSTCVIFEFDRKFFFCN